MMIDNRVPNHVITEIQRFIQGFLQLPVQLIAVYTSSTKVLRNIMPQYASCTRMVDDFLATNTSHTIVTQSINIIAL
jgi:hypothetical protein